MKGILLLMLVVLSLSCKQDKESRNLKEGSNSATNSSGVADSLLIEGEYLVFLNEEKFVPLVEISDPNIVDDTTALKEVENARFASIRQYAQSKGLEIEKSDIYVHAFSGFFVDSLNSEKLSLLLADTTEVEEIRQNFFMQTTRARMQSGTPILQTTRARMQYHPEWGYNEVGYTSKAVDTLGGGVPNTSSQSKIWIIDSGIDSTHQDLVGLVDKGLSKSFVQSGLDPVNDKNPFIDYWGHGTSCAGLAAAIPKNASNPGDTTLIGMKGVSPGAKLVSLKVFGRDSVSQYRWIIRAVNYAAKGNNLKVGDVLSFSLGGEVIDCHFPLLIRRLNRLANRRKIFFVFAAGNGSNFINGQDANKIVPGCINGERIFTIGSVDLNYQSGEFIFSAFSNYNSPPIDWVVPGNFIFTTYPGNQYAVMQGTSMSTALFAGLLHLTNGNIVKKAEVLGIHNESYTYSVPSRQAPL